MAAESPSKISVATHQGPRPYQEDRLLNCVSGELLAFSLLKDLWKPNISTFLLGIKGLILALLNTFLRKPVLFSLIYFQKKNSIDFL